LIELGPLLAEPPFVERLWAQRMLALCRAGRQADALAAFATVRGALADELGVDPGPDVRGLHPPRPCQDCRIDPRRVPIHRP